MILLKKFLVNFLIFIFIFKINSQDIKYFRSNINGLALVEIKNSDITIKANTETSYVNFGILPRSMLLSCNVKFVNVTEDAKAGFLFGIKEDPLKSYPVFMDFKNNRLLYNGFLENFNIESDIRNQQKFNFETGREYKMNLVVEDEVVVLYMDDKKALSNRIYNAVGTKWGIFACGTEVEFSNVAVYFSKNQD